jgi:signal transduction histidine kinase
VLIPLARLTREVVSLFDAVVTRKGLTVRDELDETVHLWGDAPKLKQVVTNLLVNALRYTPAPGRIRVRVAWTSPVEGEGPEARRQALLEVSDTGPGVARDERELIFERGYRARATRDIKGEGIGLSVVKEIVALHGGTIEVGGEVGEGAVFRVDLPQDRRQRALDASAGEQTGERE